MAVKKTATTKKSSAAPAKKTAAAKAAPKAVKKALAKPEDKKVYISNDDAYWFGNGMTPTGSETAHITRSIRNWVLIRLKRTERRESSSQSGRLTPRQST